MKKLGGAETIAELTRLKGGYLSVEYINSLVHVWRNDKDFEDNKPPLPPHEFIPADFVLEDSNMNANNPSDECQHGFTIGVKDNLVKGWLQEDGSLYVIGVGQAYPDEKEKGKYENPFEEYEELWQAQHLQTGKTFLTSVDIENSPQWEYERLLEVLQDLLWFEGDPDKNFKYKEEGDYLELRLSKHTLRDCILCKRKVKIGF